MSRTVAITREELEELEAQLSSQESQFISSEQEQFIRYLVSRARAGLNASPELDIPIWTWTYRF